MPRKKAEVAEKADTGAENTPVKAVPAHVYDQNGQFVRTYTKKEHGADYLILAEGFATKKGFVVKYGK